MNLKKFQVLKTVFKKDNKIGGLKILDFKIYDIATEILPTQQQTAGHDAFHQ